MELYPVGDPVNIATGVALAKQNVPNVGSLLQQGEQISPRISTNLVARQYRHDIRLPEEPSIKEITNSLRKLSDASIIVSLNRGVVAFSVEK
jgi:hypothetical protein